MNKKYIFDVSTNEFMAKVVESSYETPVIVDFWAEWCGPCKILSPILEKVVNSFNGGVLLAKVDVDKNQELAVHFGIKSIPSVKIFRDGAVADEFVGVIPEADIVRMIKNLVTDTGQEALENYLNEADRLITIGKLDDAAKIYKAVLSKDAHNLQAIGGIARITLLKEGVKEARAILDKLDELEKENTSIKAVYALAGFKEICESCGSLKKCEVEFQKNPSDKDILFKLGCCYAVNMKTKEAFDAFITILEKDMNYGEGKVKNAIISMFDIAGQTSPLTSEFRKKLANLLF